MKRNLLIITIACTLSLFAAMFDTLHTNIPSVEVSTKKMQAKHIPMAQSLPAMTFTNMRGKILTTADLRGKVVLLNFWASWCIPCRKEFPSMLELVKNFKEQIVLVAVSTDRNQNDIKRFLTSFHQEFKDIFNSHNIHIIWDKDQSISQDVFSVLRMPETIIINPQGIMVRKIVGEINWNSPKMESYINQLLQPPSN